MRSFVVVPLTLLSLVGNSLAQEDTNRTQSCEDASMVYLPYKNVTLARRGSDFDFPVSHGIELRLGNKTVACKINIADTRVYARYQMETCEYGSPSGCAQQVLCGGFSDRPIPTNGSAGYVGGYEVNKIPDGLWIPSNSSSDGELALPDFYFVTNDEDLHHLMASDLKEEPSAFLGLSEESDLLERLLNDGHISSKTWGFFASWTGIIAGSGGTIQDGGLVLGGYDASKISGPFTNFELGSHPDCLLPLGVRELKVMGQTVTRDVSRYGTEPETFEACIDPFIRGFSFPQKRRQNIELSLEYYELQADDGRERVSFDFTMSENNIYEGGINVSRTDLNKMLIQRGLNEFDDGFEIYLAGSNLSFSIPIHQVFQPARIAGPAKFELLFNNINTTVVPIYNSGSDEGIKARLGLPFLAANYLVVNLDNGTFSLAPVKREIDFAPTKLTPILRLGDCGSGDPPRESDGSVDDTVEPPTDPKDSSVGMSPGAIAGIVIGSAGVIFLAVASYFVFRRYYRRPPPFAPAPPPRDDPSAYMAEKDGTVRHQLEAKVPPQEAASRPVYHLNDHYPPGQGPQAAPSLEPHEMP